MSSPAIFLLSPNEEFFAITAALLNDTANLPGK